MAELGLVVEGGGASTTFYVLRSDHLVERVNEFVGCPKLYQRSGEIAYEAQPKLGWIYEYLWRVQKLRSGCVELLWDRSVVCTIKCSGDWWGIEVFSYLRSGMQENCIAIVRESDQVVSVIVSSSGRLRSYSCDQDFVVSFEKLRALYPSYEVKFFGLSESELPEGYQFNMIKVDGKLGYQSLEHVLAHKILCRLSGENDSVSVATKYGCACLYLCFAVSIASWINHYYKLNGELEVAKSHMQQVRNHPLYSIDLPKRVPWLRLITLLLNSATVHAVELSSDRVRVYAQQQRAARKILRELGFVISEQCVTDLILDKQDLIEAKYSDRDSK